MIILKLNGICRVYLSKKILSKIYMRSIALSILSTLNILHKFKKARPVTVQSWNSFAFRIISWLQLLGNLCCDLPSDLHNVSLLHTYTDTQMFTFTITCEANSLSGFVHENLFATSLFSRMEVNGESRNQKQPGEKKKDFNLWKMSMYQPVVQYEEWQMHDPRLGIVKNETYNEGTAYSHTKCKMTSKHYLHFIQLT